MIAFRKFFSVVNLLVLWLLIGALGYFFVISQILKPAVIKNWLSADNGYQKITSAIKDKLIVTQNGNSDEMTEEAVSAITPDLVQKEAEVAIDKYFSYMKGDKTAMIVSSSDINDQIFKAININPSDLPAESQQLVPNFKLPVVNGSSFNNVTRFYHWVFADQPYLLGIIALLMILMVFLRFHFLDRMAWLFWSVFLPFLGLLLSFLTLAFVRSYLTNTDSLFSSLSAAIREIVVSKIKAFTGLFYNAELQLVLLELTVVAIFFILYLVAKHYSKSAAVASPAAPSVTPKLSTPAK
jgi:hypothetical protein